MGLVAYSRIEHGKEDGSLVVIEEGESVTGLPKDVVETLKETGVVGETPVPDADEIAELRARVAELEAELNGAQDPNAQADADAAAKAATEQVKAPAQPKK